ERVVGGSFEGGSAGQPRWRPLGNQGRQNREEEREPKIAGQMALHYTSFNLSKPMNLDKRATSRSRRDTWACISLTRDSIATPFPFVFSWSRSRFMAVRASSDRLSIPRVAMRSWSLLYSSSESRMLIIFVRRLTGCISYWVGVFVERKWRLTPVQPRILCPSRSEPVNTPIEAC